MKMKEEIDKIRLTIWFKYTLFGLILSVLVTIVLDNVLGILDTLFLSAEGITCGAMTMAMGLALDKFSKVLQEKNTQ